MTQKKTEKKAKRGAAVVSAAQTPENTKASKKFGLVFEMVEGVDYRMNHGKRELWVNNLDTMMKFMFNEPHDDGMFTWVKERALAFLAARSREDAVRVLVDAFGGDALRAICAAEGGEGVLRTLGELYGADVERRKRENAVADKRAVNKLGRPLADLDQKIPGPGPQARALRGYSPITPRSFRGPGHGEAGARRFVRRADTGGLPAGDEHQEPDMNKITHRDREADIFQRASKSFARNLASTAATPPQASSSASGFSGINTYELHNVRGMLARFRVGKGDRLRRLDV